MATYWKRLDGWMMGGPRTNHAVYRGVNARGAIEGRWRGWFLRLGRMAAVLQLLLLPGSSAVGTQLQFTVDSAAVGVADPDESPAGKQRLKEIENRASHLSKERATADRERRPFVLRRDAMLGEAAQARERMARNQVVVVVTERQIARLENQISWSTNPELKELRAQQTRLQTSYRTLKRQLSSDQKLLEDRTVQLSALHSQLSSLDQRLCGVDEELSECRRQWLAIRQPVVKYSRGDFEGLRRVLDDWLVMDGQWPEAFAWAALCAYELGELGSASLYLDKAQRMRANPSGSNKKWPQLEALTALICSKQPGESIKSEAALANAIQLVNKDSGWETYFLLGRYYSERPSDGVRAKTHFQRALAIQPECNCAKLWLARLQTTSLLPAVRDLDSGTTALERLWEQDSRKSWRLADFLADAYSASQRSKDAESMRRKAIELAPPEQKLRLVRSGHKSPE